jgi:hypothetical protein
MARGIGGEDGPSLWTFLCCILVFFWLRSATAKATKKVEDVLELGKNSGGPLQPETTAQISALEKSVDQIAVSVRKLKYKMPHYQAIADDIWAELTSVFNIDEAKMFDELKPLDANELRAVAKCFGIKEPAVLGLTTRTLTIFKAFEWKLSDGMMGNYLTQMRKIWAKSGLWV